MIPSIDVAHDHVNVATVWGHVQVSSFVLVQALNHAVVFQAEPILLNGILDTILTL